MYLYIVYCSCLMFIIRAEHQQLLINYSNFLIKIDLFT